MTTTADPRKPETWPTEPPKEAGWYFTAMPPRNDWPWHAEPARLIQFDSGLSPEWAPFGLGYRPVELERRWFPTPITPEALAPPPAASAALPPRGTGAPRAVANALHERFHVGVRGGYRESDAGEIETVVREALEQAARDTSALRARERSAETPTAAMDNWQAASAAARAVAALEGLARSVPHTIITHRTTDAEIAAGIEWDVRDMATNGGKVSGSGHTLLAAIEAAARKGGA